MSRLKPVPIGLMHFLHTLPTLQKRTALAFIDEQSECKFGRYKWSDLIAIIVATTSRILPNGGVRNQLSEPMMRSPQTPAIPCVRSPLHGGEELIPTNDDTLLRDLVRDHSKKLQRFIVNHIGNATEAEELAQQAFVEAARSYQSFRGESQLSTWLYGIALNLVRNHLSRAPERRFGFVDETVLYDHASAEATPEEAVERKQMIGALESALSELPENMRNILLAVGLEEMSYEEAAVMLSVPVGTVRSRLSRARTALREKLKQRGVPPDFA